MMLSAFTNSKTEKMTCFVSGSMSKNKICIETHVELFIALALLQRRNSMRKQN